ncbi:UPF0039 protein YybD [Smittium culicis]|uniref:UPF0039 protein YybD n=1 Tax=Smittium culicis TaxID=133412 RepID=A0A1R1X0X5_9FUNG|nr:UPF0039 protein YybD [Smittium culicis]OMJ18757.1 UPF0039 protein YybD [Smittium culicis]
MTEKRAEVTVILAKTKEEKDLGQSVRTQVLDKEMGFSVASGIDDYDQICSYLLATLTTDEVTDLPVGSLRFFKYNPTLAKIGRVAVLKEHRKLGIGKKMILFTENVIWTYPEFSEVKQIGLNSMYDKREFYLKLGYRVEGEMFLEEGSPHIFVVKDRPTN